MHGTEVLRRLRSSTGRETPVIVMTGMEGPATELDSLRAGADDFVVKPIDFDILQARMRNVLHVSSPGPRRPRA
jgi:DNA-binding response OmpR family regulator